MKIIFFLIIFFIFHYNIALSSMMRSNDGKVTVEESELKVVGSHSRDELIREISHEIYTLDSCYNKIILKDDIKINGTLVIEFIVDLNGRVTNSKIVNELIQSNKSDAKKSIIECIINKTNNWHIAHNPDHSSSSVSLKIKLKQLNVNQKGDYKNYFDYRDRTYDSDEYKNISKIKIEDTEKCAKKFKILINKDDILTQNAVVEILKNYFKIQPRIYSEDNNSIFAQKLQINIKKTKYFYPLIKNILFNFKKYKAFNLLSEFGFLIMQNPNFEDLKFMYEILKKECETINSIEKDKLSKIKTKYYILFEKIKMFPNDMTPFLLNLFSKTKNTLFKELVAISLGYVGNAQFQKFIISILLYHSEMQMRLRAADSLGYINNEDSKKALKLSLNDKGSAISTSPNDDIGMETTITYPVRRAAERSLLKLGVQIETHEINKGKINLRNKL